MRKLIKLVITSYSIHYTKLYEARGLPTGPTAALRGRKTGWIFLLSSQHSTGHITAVIDSGSPDNHRRMVAVVTNTTRITSYNVCYTKLLRSVLHKNAIFVRLSQPTGIKRYRHCKERKVVQFLTNTNCKFSKFSP